MISLSSRRSTFCGTILLLLSLSPNPSFRILLFSKNTAKIRRPKRQLCRMKMRI
ncbi:hypothetical protein Bca4012_083032 [Brassica carinata]